MFGNFDKFDVFSVFKTSSGRPLAAPEWSSLPSVEYTQGSAWTHNLNSFVTGSPTFAISAGSLPAGITLNSNGSFSGTLTNASGTGSITYTATNETGATVSGIQSWENKPSTYPDAPINLRLTEVEIPANAVTHSGEYVTHNGIGVTHG